MHININDLSVIVHRQEIGILCFLAIDGDVH